jgi:hypothetical protein
LIFQHLRILLNSYSCNMYCIVLPGSVSRGVCTWT